MNDTYPKVEIINAILNAPFPDVEGEELTLKQRCMNSGYMAFQESPERAARCGEAIWKVVEYQLGISKEKSRFTFKPTTDQDNTVTVMDNGVPQFSVRWDDAVSMLCQRLNAREEELKQLRDKQEIKIEAVMDDIKKIPINLGGAVDGDCDDFSEIFGFSQAEPEIKRIILGG